MSETETVEYNPFALEPPDESAGGYQAEAWERVFFKGYLLKYGTVGPAAEAAGVTKEIVEEKLKASEVFAARMKEIEAYLRDMVNHEMFRRAIEPNEVPIYQRGVLVGKRLEWDNVQLRYVAERLMPEIWHLPTKIETAGGDGSLEFKLELNPGKGDNDGGA